MRYVKHFRTTAINSIRYMFLHNQCFK